MSFMSAISDEEVATVLDRSLIGADAPGETTETLTVVLGVVSEEEDKEEEGFDMEGGLEPVAVGC